MKNSPIATYMDVGPTIKKLRKASGFTGAQVGEKVGLSQSKLSKIENGKTLVTVAEAEKILHILRCPKKIQQQFLAVIEDAAKPYGRYNYIAQNGVLARETAASVIRIFEFVFVPVLLQVTAYRERVLASHRVSESELAQRLSETMQRQELLWEAKRQFHFLIPEAALYTLVGSSLVQQAQLDRLVRLTSHKRISIGIIPTRAGFLPVDVSSFVLYDNNIVVTISAVSEVVSRDPKHITEHLKIFSRLEQKAVYGAEAATVINEAAAYFSGDAPQTISL